MSRFNVNPEHLAPNGFAIAFSNGYTVSVQWNSGNYCENRWLPPQRMADHRSSSDAEVAVFPPQGKAQIHGHQSAEQVAALLHHTAEIGNAEI